MTWNPDHLLRSFGCPHKRFRGQKILLHGKQTNLARLAGLLQRFFCVRGTFRSVFFITPLLLFSHQASSLSHPLAILPEAPPLPFLRPPTLLTLPLELRERISQFVLQHDQPWKPRCPFIREDSCHIACCFPDWMRHYARCGKACDGSNDPLDGIRRFNASDVRRGRCTSVSSAGISEIRTRQRLEPAQLPTARKETRRRCKGVTRSLPGR